MFRRIEFFVFLFLLFKSTPLAFSEVVDEWIVWNIGQGQWVTHIQNDLCLHYDVGGEPGYFRHFQKNLQKLCLHRQNQISISHWDFDHYAQIFSLARTVPDLCWISKPSWIETKKSVIAIRNLNIPLCAQTQIKVWRPQHFQSLNASSGVVVDHGFLLPGDSPIAQEKIWTHEIKNLDQVHVLVLGHHGSRTSTGPSLLKGLTQLKMAVASARFAKYHHPNFLTLKRLQEFHIPVLKTEDWGHLHFSYY